MVLAGYLVPVGTVLVTLVLNCHRKKIGERSKKLYAASSRAEILSDSRQRWPH